MHQASLVSLLCQGVGTRLPTAVALGLLALLSPLGAAQSVLHTFVGNSGGDKFGHGVTGCGDVNGDGIADVAVGAVQDGAPANGSGYVRVHSGSDGSLIRQITGTAGGDIFGATLDNAGDCNGDGIPDLIVGAPFAHVNGQWKGYARVHSGMDGSVLHTFVGDNDDDFFGTRVCGLGDVNGDGLSDVAAGAVQWLSNGTGYVKIFSGFDGSLIHHITGNSNGDQFGYSLDGPGDVDGDGKNDIVIGAWWASGALPGQGMVGVYSGATGAPIHTFWGDNSSDHLGSRVGGAGDIDGDGFPDLIAGASGDDGAGTSAGAAKVFSGATGMLLYEFLGENPGDQFGNSVAGAGDVNGDGRADVAVGAIYAAPQGTQSGRVYVFSGLDGSMLLRMDGDAAGDGLGSTVSDAGDVNGDGQDDIIVGAMSSDLGGTNSGAAYVFALTPWMNLGNALAGSAGEPALVGSGPLTPGSTLTLDLSQALPSTLITLVVGLNALNAPFKGGMLIPAPDLMATIPTSPSGQISMSSTWPGGVPTGTALFMQFWMADAAGIQGFAASNGLQATVP